MSNVEKYLNEEEKIDLFNYLGPKERKLVSKISSALKWGIQDTYAFCLELLQDVNAHSVTSDVEKIFMKDLKR